MERCLRYFTILLACCTLAGCATSHNHPRDPYEKYNRAVFGMNHELDRFIFRPVAEIYYTLLPIPVADGVSNMYNNIYEPSRMANDLLQLNFRYFVKDTARFTVNSTIGIAGFFDIAEKLGTPRHTQDFGITLAKWGIKRTPYIIMPLFGSFTVSDLVGSIVDQYAFKPWAYIEPRELGIGLYTLDRIQIRASFLSTDHLVDEALDPYIFVRDAYLQSRQYDINETLGIVTEEVDGVDASDTFVAGDDEETSTVADDKMKDETTKATEPVRTPF